jgi:hypothetical protein
MGKIFKQTHYKITNKQEACGTVLEIDTDQEMQIKLQ